MPKLRLGINIDHIATVRNARNRDSAAAPAGAAQAQRAAPAAIVGGWLGAPPSVDAA